MEEVKQDETNSETTKEVTFTASSSSFSDSNGNAALPKLAHQRKTGPTRRSTKGGWTQREDDGLTKAVKLFNGRNWKKIAELFPGRTDVQCLHRWQKVLNPALVKGPWTKEEDDCIIELVKKYGRRKWSEIAKSLPGRIGKQCRERWYNHLNPGIKKDAWTKDEELVLIRAHQIYGNKWAEIGKLLPGRADNSIKNHWNCSVKKKLDSYLTSGLARDLPGVNVPDLYDHERKKECAKAEVSKQIPEKVGLLDQKTESKGGVATSLGIFVFGNSNGGVEDLQSQRVRMEITRSSKEEVNDRKPPIGIHVDGKNVSPSGLMGEHCEGDANHASMPDDLHLSRSVVTHPEISCGISVGDTMKFLHSQKSTLGPVDRIDLSSPRPHLGHGTSTTSPSNAPLDVSVCSRKNYRSPKTVLPVNGKRVIDSPKRPCHLASPVNGSGSMDSRGKIKCNKPFSSLFPCEFGSDNGQVHVQSKVPVTPLFSKDINFGRVYYEPLQLKSSNTALENSRFLSTENYLQPAKSPVCCSTPASHVRGSSLESILWNAAKSFKNTPSIMRKRRHDTSREAANANDSDGFCTPEARSGSSNDTQGSTCSWSHILSGQERLSGTDLLNVKGLSLSSPNSLQTETTASVKSVEKRLEYAFDMEWDNSKAKCSTSATASHSSDANHGANNRLLPSDNSPDSSREGLSNDINLDVA